MVNSRLNKTINYLEIDTISEDDENYPTIGYEINLEGKNRVLALGQAKYSFIKKDIIYFPIYLIVDDEVNSKIGIYEIYNNQLSEKNIFDDDGDIDPDKLGEPLYFSYFFDLLNELDRVDINKSEDINNKITKILSEDKDIDIEKINQSDKEKINQSDKEKINQSDKEKIKQIDDQDTIREKYISSESNFWVQKFLKNNNYKIKDNEGGGDCLFSAIRDAYITIKKEYTVNQLREIVASKATQDQLDNYKALYNATFLPIDKLIEERSLLILENKKIIKKHSISKDRDEQKLLKIKNKDLIKEANEILKNISDLQDEFEDVNYLQKLKNIITLDDFKEYIKSCDFWGESWAISILEHHLKIKLILLSSSEYNDVISKNIKIKDNDQIFDNVLFCGDIIHPKLIQDKVFEPVAYIILDYNGYHFKLITYKGLGIFTFPQLPNKIKALIKRCQLIGEGSYYLIPELQNYEIPILTGGKKTRKKKEYIQRKKKTKKYIL